MTIVERLDSIINKCEEGEEIVRGIMLSQDDYASLKKAKPLRKWQDGKSRYRGIVVYETERDRSYVTVELLST